MTKIVLNGAGSVEFTKELLADILRFDELSGSTIALFDTDAARLETAAAIARWTADALGAPATIEPHLDRRSALEGADHVISMIRVGGHEGLRLDFEIPGRHGVRQAMADTLGIGSIFRALCTIPPLLGLARDLHEVAPGAWLYNYTNPMAALVWAIYAGTAHQRVVGVCMSPENTAQQLAELVGVPFGEIAYLAGGMNHQSWILRLEHDGQDLYPRLRQIVQNDPDGLGRRVRVEMLKRFGYFPTESSEHSADLVPWFLPHEDQVRRFRIPVNEYLHRSERNLGSYAETRRKLEVGEPLELEPGPEYAPQIIHSIETGTHGLRQRPQRRLDRQPAGGLLHRSAVPGGPGRGAAHPRGEPAAAARRAQPPVPERLRADRAGRARGAPGPGIPGGAPRPQHGGHAVHRRDRPRVRRADRRPRRPDPAWDPG